jgi:hypothetical protein
MTLAMKTVSMTAVLLAGCASQIATEPMRGDVEGDADLYADALREAFARYEDSINAVSGRTFASADEAETVSRSLSPAYFDGLLSSALARRGLTVDGLGEFAREHEEFFAEQQARYEGLLERLDQDRLAIATQFEVVEGERDMFARAD